MSVEPELVRFRQIEAFAGEEFPRPVPKPVFYDQSGRRARLVTISIFLCIAFLLAWLGDFTTRVSTLPPLPSIKVSEETDIGPRTRASVTAINPETNISCRPPSFLDARDERLVSGFVGYGDRVSQTSLHANCGRLNEIFHEAYRLDPATGAVEAISPTAMLDPVAEHRDIWTRGNRPIPFAVISPPAWIAPAALDDFLSGPGDFAPSVARLPLDPDSGGLCLDLGAFPTLRATSVLQAARSLGLRVRSETRTSCLIAPLEAQFLVDARVVDSFDRIVVRVSALAGTASGAPVTQAARRAALTDVTGRIPAGKLQIAVDVRGVLRRSDDRELRAISFAEAMYLAELHGATSGYSAETGTINLRFVDEASILNQIWLPHAGTLEALAADIDASAPPVIWPIGYEDPATWSLIADPSNRAPLTAPLDLAGFAVLDGSGPFSSLLDAAVPGARDVSVDPISGDVIASALISIPRPHHLRAYGIDPSPNGLTISFTGLDRSADIAGLLDALDARGIRAIFFISPRDLFSSREDVARIMGSEHHLGIALAPAGAGSMAAAIWAGFRNDLVQHYLMHHFGQRARFVLDARTWQSSPDTEAQLRQLMVLKQYGYLLVQPNLTAIPEAGKIDDLFDALFEQALARPTNALNFDLRQAEGSALDDLLPATLDRLSAQGFDFLPLEAVAGIAAEDPNPASALAPTGRDDLTYSMLTASWAGIQGIILVLALIVALRSPIYLSLALLRRRRYRLDPDFHPPLTLIIPAYNEERVIRRTVESALNVDYPGLRIIVVDDGSSDGTRGVILKHFAAEPRVRLITQSNGGKWAALDHAISKVETEYMAILDADSLVDPMALRHIVQPFKDPRIGGVAGTVEIGNRGNLLTTFQTLEYMYTQQVMRRAYEVFDGIIVVPGAMGAWRVEAVRQSGLVSGDTITEDADLTIAVHRAGYKIHYQEDAKSFTEAPTTVRAFMRQRLRWTFGMFQVSWKHKRSILERKSVGFISIVDAIWYQLMTSIIYPFIDLYLLIILGRVLFALLTPASMADVQVPMQLSGAYLIIVFFDFMNILTAMIFARRFEWKFLLIAPLTRIGYRQMLYIASIWAVLSAIFGRIAQWNKLERMGTAQLGR